MYFTVIYSWYIQPHKQTCEIKHSYEWSKLQIAGAASFSQDVGTNSENNKNKIS